MHAQKTISQKTQHIGISESCRITTGKFLLIIVPMWLSAKYYNGPYMEFVRNYLAAIILIILLGLLIQLAFKKTPAKPLLIALFSSLSLLQILCVLFPVLMSHLSISMGTATFFGTNSSVHTIPYYGVGGFIGFFVLNQCGSASKNEDM